MVTSCSIIALLLCLQLAGMLKYFDAKIKLLIDPFFFENQFALFAKINIQTPFTQGDRFSNSFSVSQGNVCWQTSAGYGIISQDHKLSIELAFSSGLLCYPFWHRFPKPYLFFF